MLDDPGLSNLVRTVSETFGSRGQDWLSTLPDRLAAYARRWSITVERPFADLSYHYVALARTASGSPVVLKIGVPNPEMESEILALQAWQGHGAARLLAADVAGGAMLLEALQPGTVLARERNDRTATRVAARVMAQLWRPPPAHHSFPSVADWAGGLERLRRREDGGTGLLDVDLVQLAESLFADLLATSVEPVLLHGDLHHWNILRATRQPWLAIDPKGVVGEPAYEVGALLRNCLPDGATERELAAFQARRLAILAGELGLDRHRLAAWGAAQAVLSAWWEVEDTGRVADGWQLTARALARLLD